MLPEMFRSHFNKVFSEIDFLEPRNTSPDEKSDFLLLFSIAFGNEMVKQSIVEGFAKILAQNWEEGQGLNRPDIQIAT